MEIYWNVSFFLHLLTGIEIGGLTDYIFDRSLPLLLRAVSLFHVALPILWIWLLLRWRYDPRALKAQTLLLWATLIATYFFTSPHENVNWVFSPRRNGWSLPQSAWLIAYMIVIPVVIYWPLHRLYARYFSSA